LRERFDGHGDFFRERAVPIHADVAAEQQRAVAELPSFDAVADVDHVADAVAPEDVRERRPRGILTFGEISIRGIERGVVHAQDDFASPRASGRRSHRAGACPIRRGFRAAMPS
jgi:hypothetical protein